GWTGHEDQSLLTVAELSHDRRHAELFHRNDLSGNVSEDGAKPTALDKDIDAESGDVTQFKGKIAFAFFLKILPLGITHHVIDQRVRFFCSQYGMIEFLEIAIHSDHRWLTGADMAI